MPRPLIMVVWESVPTTLSGYTNPSVTWIALDRYSRLTWWTAPTSGGTTFTFLNALEHHCVAGEKRRRRRREIKKYDLRPTQSTTAGLFCSQAHSLRHRLQVEGAEEGRVLDLLHRGSGGGRGVAAAGFAAGAPLAPALRASPGGRGAGGTQAWVGTVASTGVRGAELTISGIV
ncbi:hypothetical protein EYF80_009888 [Liparis tanakae]|uniref:Uncharacterized protein n=1 Tax=Liparis tanakae TaxID=230148 RepID=A0A4Z2IPU5_9TELE|nr:hypothetical protein EYF80_009888 [Liparis tanakae]